MVAQWAFAPKEVARDERTAELLCWRVSLAAHYDVAVIGAGIAGLAASVLLRQAGLSVVCLDGQAYPHRKVGESLDWSSPGLLGRVGIDIEGAAR